MSRQSVPSRIAHDPSWHLAALLIIAVTFGGGGVGAGLANLVVQLAAIVAMALHRLAFALFFLRRPDWLTVLVIASVLLPLLQLIPLPAALWSKLPGRDMVASSLELAGGAGWYPLSLDMGRTLTSAVGTLVPLVIIVLGSVLPSERRRWLVRVTVGTGIATMLVGSLHLLQPGLADFYATPANPSMPGVMLGTFADRNSCAVFLDGCLLLLIALPRTNLSTPAFVLGAGGAALLFMGTVLTQSRTGIVLLAVPLALLAFQAISRRGKGQAETSATSVLVSRSMLAITVAAALAFGAAGWMGVGRFDDILTRFDSAGDGKRAEMREDSLSAAAHYWPIGAGMGTFDEVFQVDESLEYLSSHPAGRAHMDYYELAIEAGIAGLILTAAWLLWVIVATWKALGRKDWLALAGTGVVLCLAAQSVLAFPLRNQAVLALAALAIVLMREAMQKRTASERGPA